MGVLNAAVSRSPEAEREWGTRELERTEVERVAARLKVQAWDRASIAETLAQFQPDGMVRGMFYDGLIRVLASAIAPQRVAELAREAGVPSRLIPFSLYPHRQFYRLWFSALPVAYPNRPVVDGMERIAETYFPIWLDSRAGKTMGLLLGSSPYTVTKRLRDAYAISVPHNTHKLEFPRDGVIRWDASVEPSPFYPETLRGILKGTMQSQGVPMPRFSSEELPRPERYQRRFVFELDWT